MNPLQQNHLDLTRREFFGKSATGVGTIALSNLLNDAGLAAESEKKRSADYQDFHTLSQKLKT